MPKNFAITGLAGYIAPRHLQAVKETGNNLIAAIDPHDSVGIIDRFFPGCAYFREFERFDRHIEKLRRGPDSGRMHYLSICSPNFLHDAHIRFALRAGAHAICEKPLVLNPWNAEALRELEEEYGRRVYTILQLRLHPAVTALKEKFGDTAERHEIELNYITARGKWYLFSWKGDPTKSGGLATNIGIHFFDMLMWIFGPPEQCRVHIKEHTRVSGILELERAQVKWRLSIEQDDLPADCRQEGKPTYRSIRVDGEEVEFSGGFTDLHTRVYENTLDGHGFGIDDALPSIRLVHAIRRM